MAASRECSVKSVKSRKVVDISGNLTMEPVLRRLTLACGIPSVRQTLTHGWGKVMEQQTVSVAKAGIIASLNARTLVLACASPSGSRYNPRLSMIDNIHLSPTLLSSLMSRQIGASPSILLRCILRILRVLSRMYWTTFILLTSYVSYAWKNIHPKISDEAAEELTQGYVEMRRRGNFPGSSKKVITATPRQFESVVRLSDALALSCFSEWVEKHDVVEAFRLFGSFNAAVSYRPFDWDHRHGSHYYQSSCE